MNRVLLDTNVLVRFTVRDDPSQAAASDRLFASAAANQCVLVLTPAVIAETVWVLRSFYDQSRNQIATNLASLVQSREVLCEPTTSVLDALTRYASTNLDIVDCLLASQSVTENASLATFDAGIHKKCPDLKFWDLAGSGG